MELRFFALNQREGLFLPAFISYSPLKSTASVRVVSPNLSQCSATRLIALTPCFFRE